MRYITPVLSLALILSLAALGQQASPTPNPLRVIPTPQEFTPRSAPFKITSQTRIILGSGASGDDRFAAEQLNDELSTLRELQLRIVREESIRKITSGYIFVGSPRSSFAQRWLTSAGIKLGPELRAEGYILSVDAQGVVIVAESPRGRFYGVMTLLQMLEQDKRSLLLPGALIRDWPLQAIRGITDDLSRGQVSTMDNFKKIIRFLARYKLNVYSPYIEDIFVFQSHPLIGKGRGELTAAEMKELDAYAKRFHVEVIPIFETLGHWENILILPRYVQYGEFPGAHTLNISDEAVYRMLDEMIGELSAAFSSPYFNMAADESWDVGLGANKERVAASDLATVHAEHYSRVFDILKKHRKKPMMYGDVLLHNPAILDKIPKDVIIVDWHYGASDRYPSTEVFRNAGFPYVVSPAVWNFTGPFPNYLNTVANIQNLTRDGYLNGSRGILTSNWNDYGGEALRELNYYGYAWTAECAWQPLKADVSSFNTRFFWQFFGNRHAGLLGEAVYALLGNPLNQMNWHELWRHPLLPERPSTIPYVLRTSSLQSSIPLAEQLLSQLASLTTRNQEHLFYLNFIARLSHWFATKLSLSQALGRLWRDTLHSVDRDSAKQALLVCAGALATDLKKLKEEFSLLWLKTNRKANLQYLMLRYDRQSDYWEETLRELAGAQELPDPTIPSRWIYHPDGNPGKRDTTARQVRRAFFRTTFPVERPASSAKLQLIGDTYAKVWINGVEVGDVLGRRSLSLFVEHQRVKLWEVGSLLKPGANAITVEAANFDQFGSAGVNVLLEIRNGETTDTVITDPTWSVAESATDRWKSPEFDDRTWKRAVALAYPYAVIRPNLVTGRPSWIER
ncbi:MAG: hypothetical protein FJ217_03225 [Ignavibacteria bacterium]|nr:hypothetical protein [Ignavibacteria bacterium]